MHWVVNHWVIGAMCVGVVGIGAGVGDALADIEVGVQYVVPERWQQEQPSSSMRKGQWNVPCVDVGVEDAEMTLFHFGPNQGGDVQANIDRWTGQFSTVSENVSHVHMINGVQVTVVEAAGTYSSGLPMDRRGPQPDYALRGVIVEGPQGLVFFKLIGPRATVEAAEDEFNDLVHSFRPA